MGKMPKRFVIKVDNYEIAPYNFSAVDKVPSLNQLEKLSNLSKEASAIYRYAVIFRIA